jgi:REP element-mobilizing transposase RayT
MRAPETYLVTWTTYGTWQYEGVAVTPGPERLTLRPEARAASSAGPRLVAPVMLDQAQRKIVEEAIRIRCSLRNWKLHAVKVRSNHILVLVTADCPAVEALNDLKAWCTRRLMEQRTREVESAAAPESPGPSHSKRWWTEFGETSEVPSEEYLEHAIRYVNQG